MNDKHIATLQEAIDRYRSRDYADENLVRNYGQEFAQACLDALKFQASCESKSAHEEQDACEDLLMAESPKRCFWGWQVRALTKGRAQARGEILALVDDLKSQLADTMLHAETYKGECRESEAALAALRAAAQRAWDEVSGKDDVDYAELELLAVAIEASKRRVVSEPGEG